MEYKVGDRVEIIEQPRHCGILDYNDYVGGTYIIRKIYPMDDRYYLSYINGQNLVYFWRKCCFKPVYKIKLI